MSDHETWGASAQTVSLPPVSPGTIPGPRAPTEVAGPPRPSPTPRGQHAAPPVAPKRPRRTINPLSIAAAIAVGAVAVVAGVLPGKAAWLDDGAAPTTVDQQTDTGSSAALPLPGGFGGGEAAGGSEVPAPATPSDDGDLGLAVPISSPTCDGTFVVFLGAVTDPAGYVSAVNHLLNSYPGTQYTLTQGGCSSMRQQLPDGSLIYAVYVGPFPDQAAACSARDAIGGDAYVKRMDDVTPPDQPWPC